jgi:hypothetical protein
MIAVLVILPSGCEKHGMPGKPGGKSTNWLITVNVTSGKPSYTVLASPDANNGGCSYANSPQEPYPYPLQDGLEICPNDSVNWQGLSTGQKHELIVFVSDKILKDKPTSSGNAMTIFAGSDGTATLPGYASTDPKIQSIPHEWYMVLFDKLNGHVHSDDPKIMIGKG